MSSAPIVGLGEVLWDLLPSGKVLGGAPCNFAFHCKQLGHPAEVVSRVGEDALGREIRQQLQALGLSDAFVQSDAIEKTGTVSVEFDASGHHTFTIHPGAWDQLAWTTALEELAQRACAVCFGSLIQRSATARQTVQRFLQAAQQARVIFDINLRQHYYNREIIEASLQACNWFKLNDEELLLLQPMLTLKGTTQSDCLAELRDRYALELVALTRGEKGCLVQTATEEVEVPGVKVQVVDTIGAGDAFTAGLLVYSLEGKSVQQAATFATRYAGRVAAAAGGTPVIARQAVEADDKEVS